MIDSFRHSIYFIVIFTIAASIPFASCDGVSSRSSRPPEGESNLIENCLLSTDHLIDSGVGRDGIPALTNPPLVGPGAENAEYLRDTSRVIGLLAGDRPLAVPHQILWHHEIVNLNHGADRPLAITYCPLTGSSLAFDRSPVNGAEFGVSGLLLDNNLVMFERRPDESLWPQMNRVASCGPATGEPLDAVPIIEMRWNRWRTLHPDTKVLSSETGHPFSYSPFSYPYGDYERHNNESLLFEKTPIDPRRPPKERVLGIPVGKGGLALPFGALSDRSAVHVVKVAVGGSKLTVFWNREAQAAMAFQTPTSFFVRDGRILDDETESIWSVEGRAVEGPRRGEQLQPVDSAYVAFWFAWAVFQPKTEVWSPNS